MEKKTVYLLLGANVGDRQAQLSTAAAKIERAVGKITDRSRLYETQAWGMENQPNFINQALAVQTAFSPQEVLTKILNIETEMGRVRTEKWAARTIDIDILLYENAVVNEPNLTIPHPHLTERNFALVPLMDVAGEVEHPILKKTIEDIYFDCTDKLDVFMVE